MRSMAVTLEEVANDVRAIRHDMEGLYQADAMQEQARTALAGRVEGLTAHAALLFTSLQTVQAAVAGLGHGEGATQKKLNFQAAIELTPSSSWEGLEDKKVHWREYYQELFNYATALYREGAEVLKEVGRMPTGGKVNLIEIAEGEEEMVTLLDSALYSTLYKFTNNEVRKVVTIAGQGNGLQA